MPGSDEMQCYREDPEGSVRFTFVSFNQSSRFEACLLPTEVRDEDFEVSEPLGNKAGAGEEQYQAMVRAAVARIKSEDWGKVVLSRFETRPLRISPLHSFMKLVKAYPSACVYLFSHREYGVWMGATPETLLSGDSNRVESMSLAGTARLGQVGALGSKEKEEQQMVTDFIRTCFQQVSGLANIKTGATREVKAGHLLHLQTMIEATPLKGFDKQELLTNLHPTPAVAGLPRNEALAYLKDLEEYDREFYTGYFGVEESGSYHYFVNLRCMRVYADAVKLFAGGGLTAASNPKDEWEETRNKMQTLGNLITP